MPEFIKKSTELMSIIKRIEDQTNKKLIWTDSQGIRSVSRVGDINPMDILRLAYE